MRFLLGLVFLLFALAAAVAVEAPPELRLEKAVVVAPAHATARERKAVEMLVDEVAKRTQIRWPARHARPPDGPAITVRIRPQKLGAEGYRLSVSGSGVEVAGEDERGVIFGVGRLLRELLMRRGSVTVPAGLNIATAPKYRLRGHQLGYRPKTNSYDGWDLRQWEQYLRDLAVFGTNAIELIPPRSDDDADSPHFPLPPMEMMTGVSRLADEYGLDVWIWYPAMDPDYSKPETVNSALKEWGEVFRKLPRVDAVFVPGGDPGHTAPKVLMPFLEKQARSLRRFHPKAQMWVAPQGFSRAWMADFLQILKTEQPVWLDGIVYGPQVRTTLTDLRAAVPVRYPIRQYPDITHTRQSQYPVAEWDSAFAWTEAREPINPRPVDEAAIIRATQPYTIGSITYSEGCNDDVNKIVWSSFGWDPDADVDQVLREYSRYFIGPDYTESFSRGLLALERNWRGPLAANEGVYATLEQFQALERSASPQVRRTWRFQQALYRAYYDAYTRARLLHETRAQAAAMEALVRAPGSVAGLGEAEAALETGFQHPRPEWRARIFELAEALFQSIHMQLSVLRYQAIEVGRGANLDTVDVPLTDAPWLRKQLAEIRSLPDEAERRNRVEALVHWTDPDPGGFYDAPGSLPLSPHIVEGPDDPTCMRRPFLAATGRRAGRAAWDRHTQTLYDTPLRMRYTGLDPNARYRLRIVYSDESKATVRLTAGTGIEIHPLLLRHSPMRPLEFELPRAATASGTLGLTWTRDPEAGGNGRGCQVCEIWVVRR